MTGSKGATRTILLVEDFDDTRQMMKFMLEQSGYRVIEAINGQEAVDAARRDCPDLILMDISLPLIDGLTATRLIRAIENLCEVPIVAVTAHGRDGLLESALEFGCTDYLPKPVDFDQLEKLLKRYLPETT